MQCAVFCGRVGAVRLLYQAAGGSVSQHPTALHWQAGVSGVQQNRRGSVRGSARRAPGSAHRSGGCLALPAASHVRPE